MIQRVLEQLQRPHRILSPDESCGRALFRQGAFSSCAHLSDTWHALTAGCLVQSDTVPAEPAVPQILELDVGQITGWALLESLCAHLEPGTAAKAGTSPSSTPLCSSVCPSLLHKLMA